MANILEQYHAFLDEKEINNIQDLIFELICEQHLIIPIEDEKYPELLMLCVSEDTDLDIEINHIFNGLIINKNNIREIVCYSGKYIDFITEDNVSSILNLNLKGFKFFESNDGISIRLFFHNNKWIVSTDNMIDSSNEYSYADHPLTIKILFESCCTDMNFNYQQLDKKYIYVFGIYHSLNRNVIKHRRNELIHIKTYLRNTFDEVNVNLNLPKVQELKFNNLFNLLETYEKSEWTMPGFIIENLENKKLYKMLTPKFLYVLLLKTIDDDKIIKYLKLKADDLLEEYLRYFDEDKNTFDLFMIMLDSYADYFYKSYIELKIYKIEKPLDKYIKYEMDIIYKIHGIYLRTQDNTSLDTVKMVLKFYNPLKLKELLTNRDIYEDIIWN